MKNARLHNCTVVHLQLGSSFQKSNKILEPRINVAYRHSHLLLRHSIQLVMEEPAGIFRHHKECRLGAAFQVSPPPSERF